MASRPKLGILALTLELYETLAPGVRENRQQWLECGILPRMREEMDISFDEVVFKRDDIERVLDSYEQKRLDGIIVICLTYSPSELALSALSKTSLPIMVWNTQELWGVDRNFTVEEMSDNHGVHGTQDLCSVLCRHGVKFQYVTSHMRDENALSEIMDFAVAAASVRKLQTAKVGQIGGAFPYMGDFVVDSTFLTDSLGPQVVKLSLGEFLQACENVDADSIAKIVADYKANCRISAGITPQELEQTARCEIALRGFVTAKQLSAITYLFSSFGEDDRSPTLPFVAASRLMSDGIGFGGEGDVIGALGNYFLNELSNPAGFSEIFTTDFEGNTLFMSHMGEANVGMADGAVEMIARPTPITKTIYRQLALRFPFKTGEATFFSLVQAYGGKWRFIVSAVDIVDWQPVENIPCPQFKIAPRNDVRDWLTAYAKVGGPHHNAICFGDARNRLRMAAEMLDAEYAEI